MLGRTLFATALLAVTGAVSAQSLARPSEFYFDADANTVKPVIAVRETGDAATDKLVKAIERNPRAKGEVAQLAHLAMTAGRLDLGKQLYGRALTAIDRSDSLWRAVVWNYGWDLYRTGDFEGAFAQWRLLVESRAVTGVVDAADAGVVVVVDRPQGRSLAVVRRRRAHRAAAVEQQREVRQPAAGLERRRTRDAGRSAGRVVGQSAGLAVSASRSWQPG